VTVTELEEVVRILPDELAWDMLARDGWRLATFRPWDRLEAWERDGERIRRWREKKS